MKLSEKNINQLNKEKEYITYIYFSDLKIIDDENVILNNIPYTIYKDNGILLIPKNFTTFNDDFEDIIIYNTNDLEIHFSILSKNHKIVEYTTYNFFAEENGNSIGNKRYEYFYDSNNKLQNTFLNSNDDIVKFLNSLSNHNLFNGSYNIKRIKRNSEVTKLNEIHCDNIIDAYLAFDKNFEIIDDNEKPLIEILNCLENVKSK